MNYELSDKELHPDYRDVDDMVMDFFREGESNLNYPKLLSKLKENDHLLEALFNIARAQYVRSPHTSSEKQRAISEIEDIVWDTIKEEIVGED